MHKALELKKYNFYPVLQIPIAQLHTRDHLVSFCALVIAQSPEATCFRTKETGNNFTGVQILLFVCLIRSTYP